MTITSRFNRAAAGLSLSLLLLTPLITHSQQETVKLIPEGQNPPALAKIYKQLSVRSRLPNPADFRIDSSVTAVSDIPDNQWLRDLKDMPPEQAEAEVRSCLSSLCEHKYPLLDSSDKFIARIMVLEAMFYNGLNAEEFRIYSEFLSRHEADAAFYNRDKQITNTVVAEIYTSTVYKNLRDKIIPTTRIISANAVEQFHLRQNFMQYISDRIRAAFGYAPIPVYLDKFPAKINGTAALTIDENYTYNFPDSQIILVNYLPSAVDNVNTIIELMAHEIRHSIDFSYRAEFLARNIDSHDPRFSHVGVINLNENAVIPLCEARTSAQVECPQQYNWYRDQYRERSAINFARKFIEEFRQEATRHQNTNALSRLKP